MTRAQVDLQTGEVFVTYDPRTATVDAIIAAVNQADGPFAPRQYRAEVKDGPRPASAR